jgi:hypothetical protein
MPPAKHPLPTPTILPIAILPKIRSIEQKKSNNIIPTPSFQYFPNYTPAVCTLFATVTGGKLLL